MASEKVNALYFRIANALTLTRLLGTPFVVWLLLEADRDEQRAPYALALILFLQATDLLDGFLARRAGAAPGQRLNPTGEVLDPIADKLYINSAYVTLAVIGRIPVWAAGIVVARDAAILIGWMARYWLTGDRLLPNAVGKAADATQALGLIVVVAGASPPVETAILWLVATMSALSGVSYGLRAVSPVRRA